MSLNNKNFKVFLSTRLSRIFFVLFVLLLCGSAQGSSIQDSSAQADNKKHTEFLELFRQYLQIDTSNPPGGELAAAHFFADIFEHEGIPYDLVESAPGRSNIRAVIKGRKPSALILLHHMDVVPANPEQWEHPPFAALMDDQFIHGRGAVDTKSLGIFHLNAFLNLHRSGVVPDRDVVFMATADEESGGAFGVGWLMEHWPEWFKNIDAVLNEGAVGKSIGGKTTYAVEVTQKIPLWLRLETQGEAGHGAAPHAQTAVTRLLYASTQLQQLQFIPRAIAPVADYFTALAPLYASPWRERFSAINDTVKSTESMAELHEFDHRLYALLTSSCTPTRLQGSGKINVVPGMAFLELDCRLLPDANPEQVVERIQTLLGPEVQVRTLLSFKPGVSSSRHPLFESITAVLQERYPEALLLPKVSPGFTDSHFFRERGVTAFGFSPILLDEDGSYGVHGVNERLTLDDFYQGLQVVEDIVIQYVTD
ncbi:MAG: M20/M25/M40 family metallo-hydrolase [Porticoccaceae bacterium]